VKVGCKTCRITHPAHDPLSCPTGMVIEGQALIGIAAIRNYEIVKETPPIA